ncbi:MAG: GNAT family N-acetyltransferase, partial [Pseudonocardiaceae bacterium]
MLSPEYPIRTKRLVLRPFTRNDIDDAFAYQSHEDVCRYIPDPPRTREGVAERTASPHARSTIEEPGHALLLAVQLRPAGRVIGDVMLHWVSREHGTGEIGYVFNPDYAGH